MLFSGRENNSQVGIRLAICTVNNTDIGMDNVRYVDMPAGESGPKILTLNTVVLSGSYYIKIGPSLLGTTGGSYYTKWDVFEISVK